MANLQTRITYPQDGTIDRIISRFTRSRKIENRPSQCVRRSIIRYQQILEGAAEPKAEIVVIIGRELIDKNPGLLFDDQYPERNDVYSVIDGMAIPQSDRDVLVSTVSSMSFADYARFIEAVETYFLE